VDSLWGSVARNVPSTLGVVLAFLAVTAYSAEAAKSIKVSAAWARATPPGTTVGALYFRIENRGDSDRLLRVETSVSDDPEIHESRAQAGMMQMRPVAEVTVPKGGVVTFEPRGMHLMLTQLKRPLIEGQTLRFTLVFEKAGAISAVAQIAGFGADHAPGEDHAGHR
jgi:copper(I)-binding protein